MINVLIVTPATAGVRYIRQMIASSLGNCSRHRPKRLLLGSTSCVHAVVRGNDVSQGSLKQWHALALGLALAVGATTAFGVEQSDASPYLIVKNTTEQVLAEIETAREYFDDDPQHFYDRIDTILSEVTDFYSFSRSVMGIYASKRSMDAMDAAGKEKLERQIDRFVDKFHGSLVKTYAKGLLNFSGQRIEVLKPRANDSSKSMIITQQIYGDAAQPYVVKFKMRKDREGAWKVRNVTIEAINLGKIFREQFASEARKHDGDLDQVIDNWSSETAAKQVEDVRKDEGSDG